MRRREFLSLATLSGLGSLGLLTGAGCNRLIPPPSAQSPGTPALDDEWELVFYDDFTSVTTHWEKYTGKPASDKWVQWDPRLVSYDNDSLVLSGTPAGGGWHTGAVTNWRDAQTYGQWEINFRSFPHRVLSFHILLWPQAKQWPPEIDIAESFLADRQRLNSFVHYSAYGEAEQVEFAYDVDATKPTTVAVRWLPGALTFTCNGREVGAVSGDRVPDQPMWLAIQVEAQATLDGHKPADNGRTTSVAPNYDNAERVVEINWVRVSRPAT